MITASHRPENRRLDDLPPKLIRSARSVGVLLLLVGVAVAIFSEPMRERFFAAYLVNFAYFLSLALGALFFVILQHLTRSGWSVVVRRLAEGVAGTLLPLAVLFIPIILGRHYIYEWTVADHVEGDPLLEGKQPYLNTAFFVLRWVIYLVIWVGFANFYLRRSVKQDDSGDPNLTLGMERVSPPAMILFGFTLTFASFDLLMSVDPHWFSTIFGVYYFSGSVVGLFALLPVMVWLLQRSGRLTESITTEHYHDMGKLLFGFIVFWAYIAFSQYMLIWYANIPEETAWYLTRQTGSWRSVSLLLLFGHFFLPFLALISRHPKRRRGMLVAAAVWMLLMHWVDIYWLVMPTLFPGRATVHWLDVVLFGAIGAFFLEGIVQRLKACSLVPERDPRLGESLAFENM